MPLNNPVASVENWQLLEKAADQTVNNSVTLVNDNHLVLSMAANEVWLVEGVLLVDTGTTPDIKIGFAYPVNCIIHWQDHEVNGWRFGTTASAPETPWVQTDVKPSGGRGAGTICACYFKAIVINGANAGNLILQWAQNTANVSDTKLLEGSSLLCHKAV